MRALLRRSEVNDRHPPEHWAIDAKLLALEYNQERGWR